LDFRPRLPCNPAGTKVIPQFGKDDIRNPTKTVIGDRMAVGFCLCLRARTCSRMGEPIDKGVGGRGTSGAGTLGPCVIDGGGQALYTLLDFVGRQRGKAAMRELASLVTGKRKACRFRRSDFPAVSASHTKGIEAAR